MCGIVGYVGKKNVKDVVINGLKKLEYRGYDSAGIALKTEKEIVVVKESGRIDKLEKKVKNLNPECSLGMGHTRWATHGKPNEINSHPHFNKDKTIVIVHNGIIENYRELKVMLQDEGYNFITETDTEVVPHLIDKIYRESGNNPEETLIKLIRELRGAFALGIMFSDIPDTLFCIKKDSPMIIGRGEGENFIASDIPAILEHTKSIFILDEKEIGIVKQNSIVILDEKGLEVKKEPMEITWNIESAEKGGYDHFMIKEIFEQPKVVRQTLMNRLTALSETVDLSELSHDISKFDKIYFVACGTAYHACLIAKYLIEKIVRMHITVDVASEFRYKDPIIDKDTLVVAVSQSGETADTLAAVRLAKEKGSTTLGVINVVGSSIDRECDMTMYTSAGPEIAVASTKAYTSQVMCMYLLATYLGLKKKYITSDDMELFKKEMLSIPQIIETILESAESIKDITKKYYKSKNVFYIGRGMDYYIAKEGSLKLKELAYIHSEAYQAGELKHGPIALMESSSLVIGIAMDDELFEKTASNLKEVKARGAKVLMITKEGMDVSDVADDVIYIPNTIWAFTSVVANIPQQLIAYYMALFLGNDVDKPRNLAKSVTVE